MSEKTERATRILSTRIVRTGFGSLRHLWRERFGRKLESKTELLDWLCSEGYERDDAEDMTCEEVAELLRPDPNELDDNDRMILDAMPIGVKMKAKEIADAAHMGRSTVEHRLCPDEPLRRLGFIEVTPGKQGYTRKS